jgi:1,2-phenylacetyl-CoA epoxidase catalytic subunit
MFKQANITISQVVEVHIAKRMTNEELREAIFNKVKESINHVGLNKWLDENTVEYCLIDEEDNKE